jgi:hypothetical protein
MVDSVKGEISFHLLSGLKRPGVSRFLASSSHPFYENQSFVISNIVPLATHIL